MVEGEGRDLFLGGAVEDETFPGGRNAVDQAAAVGAGDEVSVGVEGQHADGGLVTFEEQRVFAFGGDTVDFSVVAGGHVEIAGVVERQIPDVFGAGGKIDGGSPG